MLLSPLGREALTRAAALLGDAPGSELAVAAALRREYPASLAAAAVAQHELRLAAREKFSRAMEMLFTRAGYEQSSSETIARHRAARFGGARRVADLCCGIGGDLIALAAARGRPARAGITGAGITGDRARRRPRRDPCQARHPQRRRLRRSWPGPRLRRGRARHRTGRRQRGLHRPGPPGRDAPVPRRGVAAAARLVPRPRRPGPRRLRQGRARPARRADPAGLGGRVHRRRP